MVERAEGERRIAFCTTCKGRTQHLKLTLPKNLEDNRDYENCVFIVLNYSSSDDLLDYLARHHAKEIASGRLVVYSHFGAGAFRMAHAKNMAHRCGLLEGAEILVNLDADNYTGLGFASYINRTAVSAEDFLAVGKIIRGVTPRGVTGRIAVHRHAFLKTGGYDERFETWSPDDKDFDHRMRRLGLTRHTIPDQFIDAVRHNDKMRFREYPHVRTSTSYYHEQQVHERDVVVVNFGVIGCGIVYRNEAVEAIILEALPTRIFGIGLHKTGTTSLHQALQLLGYESAHWPSAHWAKAIYNEMRHGRSPTLERTYAASDLPLALIFREIDTAYPGSKFVLTTRAETAWLKSVRDHWDFEKNPFRHQWNGDPFTHIVHRLLYGRRMFDADIFLARYRRHTAEVMEHFANRPQDLLVLPIETPNHWRPLCAFLGEPAPSDPYPKSNWRSREFDQHRLDTAFDVIHRELGTEDGVRP